MKAGENIKGKAKEIDIDPALEATMGKLAGFRQWFEKRLDDAVKAAEVEKRRIEDESGNRNGNGTGRYIYRTVFFVTYI